MFFFFFCAQTTPKGNKQLQKGRALYITLLGDAAFAHNTFYFFPLLNFFLSLRLFPPAFFLHPFVFFFILTFFYSISLYSIISCFFYLYSLFFEQ